MGQAKLIDASFNLVARRGPQAVLGYPSFRTTTNMLMRMMEATLVSFDLFSTQPSRCVHNITCPESIRQITRMEAKIYHDVDLLLISFSDCATNIDGHDD